jgi:hypothetical protein
VDILTEGEHDVALLPRSKFGHLSHALHNRFVDGYLEVSTDGEATELPANLAKLLNGIVPTGHPSKGENVPRTLLAEGACIVALVLGDVPTPLDDDQRRRIVTRLRSEDWQLYEVSLSELVFGWDFSASEENRAVICGVILALLAFEEVQRRTAGAAQDLWAAEVQRRRASDDLLNTGRGEDPDYLSDETIQPRLAWDDDPTTPDMKGASIHTRKEGLVTQREQHPTTESGGESLMAWGTRRHLKDDEEGNPYIKKRGTEWVIVQKGTGKVLSHHESREEAEASFRAMEAHIHG